MKKLFLIPLMACMMCLYAGATDVANEAELRSAISAALTNGSGSITLSDNITLINTEDGDATTVIQLYFTPTLQTKTITLDINGHTLKSSAANNLFRIYNGALNVINSVPGEGAIENNKNDKDAASAFLLHGTIDKTVNTRTAAVSELYTYLCIAEGVTVTSKGTTIQMDIRRPSTRFDEKTNKGTEVYAKDYFGLANGIRVEVKGRLDAAKYGIKPNGYISYPDPKYFDYFNNQKYKGVASNPITKEYFYGANTTVTMSTGDSIYSPYIHIYPSAVITVPDGESKAAPVYCSGYARWLIEGNCAGSTGLYIKNGDVTLHNAVIESTWTDPATLSTGKNSGIDGGGNAIVMESNKAYPGSSKITVVGDTKVSTEAENGAALTEKVADNTQNSNIESITINGGNFTGDNAILISTKTIEDDDAEVKVNGITLVGDVVVGDDDGQAAINSIINSDAVHTTEVVNEDGSTTVVISEGKAPTEYADFDAAVAAAAADPTKNIKWTGIATVEIGDAEGATSVSKTLPELQMVSGSAGNLQQIIVHKNSELHIKHLIMNDFARIDVKAGGKLIVEGEQGMNAPSKENILIETSEANPAYFMFNPAVTSNKHPLAKVQMWSKGYQRNPGDFVWQRFGMPGWSTDVRLLDVDFDAPTYAFSVNTDKTPINDWSIMGWYDTFKPFGSYILSTTNNAAGDIYTFACPMVGNENAVLGLYSHYNYFANSYTAPIDIWTLISDFEEKYPNVDATIYLYDPQTDYWSDINFATLLTEEDCPTTIEPMFAFILVATPSVSPVIDYKAAIWDPIMNPSPAPARRQGAQFSTARIEIVAEDGTADHVNLVEGNQFTAAYDNAYDAEKLTIGERTFLYANGCRDKMGIVATDNLEGTLLSMNTTDQTSFTMQFSNVNGLNYAVRDMLTGTETEIVEGATYMFSVPADATVEGRFKIVAVSKVPTAIENTEVENAEKGIYNMAGQYVGTDFHILPAGVYVVDGKKIVK